MTRLLSQSTLFLGTALLLALNACAPIQPVSQPHPPRPPGQPSLSPPISLPPPLPQPPAHVSNVRAVWVSNTLTLDWEKAARSLQQAGFNTMYVNFASSGAAFYPHSAVVPSLTRKDTLGRGLQLARQNGLDVHAKFIVTFMFKSPPEFQRQLIQADRVMRGPDGKPILQSGQTWLCPSQAANRQLATRVVSEMLGRYPVTGLQLDYIRFSEQPCCYCGACRQSYEAWSQQKVAKWPADAVTGPRAAQFNQWRQAVITDWVREIAKTARAVRPGIVINAAVFPDPEQALKQKGQDWLRWLREGLVDYVCPMVYTGQPAEFQQRAQAVVGIAPHEKMVLGIGSWKCQQMDDLLAQIHTVHRLGPAGFALFSYDDCEARNFLPVLRHLRP